MPTALIVEDEPEANELLARLIQLRGYRTVSAFTGGEALACIEGEHPDVVFLDLMLPDVSGYEVCKALKARKSTALIPVVMVTARVALDNRIRSFRVGADQYIPKPYTPDQIFQALEDAHAWTHPGHRPREGEIPFFANDEGETLRRIGRLRCELLAATPLEPDASDRVFDALGALWNAADAWGRAHRVSRVAELRYHILPDGVALHLTDLSDWFRNDPRPALERWHQALSSCAFDEVADEPTRGRVRLVVRQPECRGGEDGGDS